MSNSELYLRGLRDIEVFRCWVAGCVRGKMPELSSNYLFAYTALLCAGFFVNDLMIGNEWSRKKNENGHVRPETNDFPEAVVPPYSRHQFSGPTLSFLIW